MRGLPPSDTSRKLIVDRAALLNGVMLMGTSGVQSVLNSQSTSDWALNMFVL